MLENFDEAKYIEEYHEAVRDNLSSRRLPWWMKRSAGLLISVGFHAVLLIICAYTAVAFHKEALEKKDIRIFIEPIGDVYDVDVRCGGIISSPEIIDNKPVEKPILQIEEEVGALIRDMESSIGEADIFLKDLG